MRALLLTLVLVLPGCLEDAPAETEPLDEAPEEPTPTRDPRVEVRENHWTLRTPVVYLSGDGTPVETVRSSTTTWVVEMDWTPATPLADEMKLEVQTTDGEVVDAVSGTPPLRLVVAAPPTGDMLLYGAPTKGVVPDQTVTFYSSQFRGGAPDGYTAVP